MKIKNSRIFLTLLLTAFSVPAIYAQKQQQPAPAPAPVRKSIAGTYFSGSNLEWDDTRSIPLRTTYVFREDGTYKQTAAGCYAEAGKYIYRGDTVTLKFSELAPTTTSCAGTVISGNNTNNTANPNSNSNPKPAVKPADAADGPEPEPVKPTGNITYADMSTPPPPVMGSGGPRDRTFTVVRWSDNVYLVGEYGPREFADMVNLGLLPQTARELDFNMGRFYIREGDENKPVSGLPEVPAAWQDWLLKEPVTAKILFVREGEYGLYFFTIDKGKDQGLRVGMKMLLNDTKPGLFSYAEITSVADGAAEVRYKNPAEPGDTFTTRFTRP